MLKRKEKPPEHIANALYLEWFSESNGRVVIESTDYELTVSAPEWQMTPTEDAQRARDVAKAMHDFLGKLTNAIEQHQRGQKDPAFTVAYLKRGLNHLHKAHAALEAAGPKNLLPTKVIADTRQQLFDIREAILQLMDHFRGQTDA